MSRQRSWAFFTFYPVILEQLYPVLWFHLNTDNFEINYLPHTSLMAQLVRNPPVMWKTWVQSLGWEDPLERGKATHSSILA